MIWFNYERRPQYILVHLLLIAFHKYSYFYALSPPPHFSNLSLRYVSPQPPIFILNDDE